MGERGSVLGLAVIFVPVLVLTLSGLLDVGTLVMARYCLQTAADLGALAAVQEVDLERLASGDRRLDEDSARDSGQEWAETNMQRLGPVLVTDPPPVVEVMIYNAGPDRPLRHGGTGRMLVDPTVHVRVEAVVLLPVGVFGKRVSVVVQADASVLGPKEGD